jgi:hypothetical protein
MKLLELKERIARGEYQIEPGAVADMIIRRLIGLGSHAGERGRQTACSYPARSTPESVNTTPAAPSTTRPTHVQLAPARPVWGF